MQVLLVLGQYRTRVEHDNRDSILARRGRHDLHLTVERGLAHPIEHRPRPRLRQLAGDRAVARADRDQLLLLAGEQALVEGLGDDQRALDVDGHDGVEERIFQIAEALGRPVAVAGIILRVALAAIVVHAGIVDQNVDRHVRQLRGQRGGLVRIGHVERLDAHLAAVFRRQLGERLRWRGAPVCGDDRPPLGGILLGKLQADT